VEQTVTPSVARRDFIKLFNTTAQHKGRHTVFEDFLDLATLAIRKTTVLPAEGGAIEQSYMDVVRRHEPETIRRMPELLAFVHFGLAEGDADFLGDIACELELLNSGAGQIFTPWNISEMMARMVIGDAAAIGKLIAERGFFSLYEPAAGAGCMVLAAAKVMRGEGIDPGQHLYVVANDISTMCFKMCYLQLAIAGIPALVRRGDTLADEYTDRALTPAFFPFYASNTSAFDRWRHEGRREELRARLEAPKPLPQVATATPRIRPQKVTRPDNGVIQHSLF
jgi:type I restriction-modification system DNA methylase subunit